MTLHTWLAFVAASFLISLSPGSGAISCMSLGMQVGYRRGLWGILGLQLGVLFLVAVVAAGLGALLATSTLAFTLVKVLGVAYLVYLGVRQLFQRGVPVVLEQERGTTRRQLILQGFLVNASNPKGMIFMLAVLTQFVNQATSPWSQYLICAATLCVSDVLVMSGYTIFASRVLRLLRHAHQIRRMNQTFGVMFIVAGLLLASFRRSTSI